MPPTTPHLLMSVSKSLVGVRRRRAGRRGRARPRRAASRRTCRRWRRAATRAPPCGTCWTCARASRSPRTTWTRRAEVRLLEQAIGWAPRSDPGVPATHVRLPADAAAEGAARRAVRVPHLRDRRARLGLRGRRRRADAGADVATCCGRGSGPSSTPTSASTRSAPGMFDGGISRDAARPGPVRRR